MRRISCCCWICPGSTHEYEAVLCSVLLTLKILLLGSGFQIQKWTIVSSSLCCPEVHTKCIKFSWLMPEASRTRTAPLIILACHYRNLVVFLSRTRYTVVLYAKTTPLIRANHRVPRSIAIPLDRFLFRSPWSRFFFVLILTQFNQLAFSHWCRDCQIIDCGRHWRQKCLCVYTHNAEALQPG